MQLMNKQFYNLSIFLNYQFLIIHRSKPPFTRPLLLRIFFSSPLPERSFKIYFDEKKRKKINKRRFFHNHSNHHDQNNPNCSFVSTHYHFCIYPLLSLSLSLCLFHSLQK